MNPKTLLKEAECFALYNEGKTQKQVAEIMGLSLTTVSQYIRWAKRRKMVQEERANANKQTNFKKITASAECLAAFISYIKITGKWCRHCINNGKLCQEYNCSDGIKQWLEQEAEE